MIPQGGASGKELAGQCRRPGHGFDPGFGRSPGGSTETHSNILAEDACTEAWAGYNPLRSQRLRLLKQQHACMHIMNNHLDGNVGTFVLEIKVFWNFEKNILILD